MRHSIKWAVSFTSVALVTLMITATASTRSKEYKWTTWSRKGFTIALLELSKMRDHLSHNNLFDIKNDELKVRSCTKIDQIYRSADGSCNDLTASQSGQAGAFFGRNIPLNEITSEDDVKILKPSPREISLNLLKRDAFKPVPFLNMFAASWIQFMTHDWFSHGENDFVTQPFELPLADTDPLAQRTMTVFRTVPSAKSLKTGMKSYSNEVTHWWDGSQIYGSNFDQQKKVRAFKDGLLKVDGKGLMPLDSSKTEVTGFNKNWWVGLSVLHNLFVKEHNSIAQMLKQNYPQWSDENLFQTARLINAALMAKIHTVEWTPAILANPVLKEGMEANWYGLLNRGISVRGAPKDTRYLPFIKNHVLGGIVGNKTENFGVPFSITEEFVSVYRLHSLLPETLNIENKLVSLKETRDTNARKIIEKYSIASLVKTFGHQNPGALTLNNFPNFMQELELPYPIGKVDMGTIDIIRDRERGVPRYNQFRRLLGLKPLEDFEEFFEETRSQKNRELLITLKKTYHNNIEDVDLLVGCLAEQIRPRNFGFGETAFQVFILMASRRLMADRFFTVDYTPQVYTPEGLKWIDQTDFKTLILRHFPQFSNDLDGVKNAFNPWN